MPENIQPPDDDIQNSEHWSLLREDVSVVLWVSFLVASVFTMIFYAWVDPADLMEILKHPRWLPNAMTTYALGFFGFWAMAIIASGLTAFMIDTSHEHADQVVERAAHQSEPRQ